MVGWTRTVAPGRWQGHAPTSCPSGLPLDLQNKGSPMPSRDCATHVSQCSVFATALPRAVANHIPKEEEFRGPQVPGDSPVTYIACMLVYAYHAAWGMKARRTSQRPTPAQLPPSAELLSPPGWKREGASEIWESIPARYRGLRQKEIGLEKSFLPITTEVACIGENVRFTHRMAPEPRDCSAGASARLDVIGLVNVHIGKCGECYGHGSSVGGDLTVRAGRSPTPRPLPHPDLPL